MFNLAIQHQIHLNRKQRYAIHDGVEVAVVGISVPIWFHGRKNTEPGHEVFCRYVIRNTQLNTSINVLNDGYDITIPYRPVKKLYIPDEEWRALNLNNPALLDQLYQRTIPEISSRNLLDTKDGGSSCLMFREQNKIYHEGKEVDVFHFVIINKLESLIDSITEL